MGLVTRPTKTGGTQQYTTEVAAGFTTAKASEVDADLNTLYTLVNGQLDSANILSLSGSKLTAASVTEAKLADASVSARTLVPGLVVRQHRTASPITSLLFSTAETTVVNFTSYVFSASGLILIGGWWSLGAYNNSATTEYLATIRVKRGGSPIATVNMPIGPHDAAAVPVPFGFFAEASVAGLQSYTITAQSNNALLELFTQPGTNGLAHLIELGGG